MPSRGAWGSSSAACPVAAGCLLLALLLLQQPHAVEPAKRLDCRAFCRLTGFRFNAGLCKCGYMLFASKRSQQPPLTAGYLSGGQDPGEAGGYRSLPPAERFQLEVAVPSPLSRHPSASSPTLYGRHGASQSTDSADPVHATAARAAAAALLGHKPDAGPDADDAYYR
ncbi:uncharacterized protein LOC119455468 [Dermacentor silvarum]|uniref:uncharacterized protein LOC119455468 n=1 Tax=Dermacentor silvarum TaxID=543639 RepID=UPI00189B5D02|nr:uncharacterized protein LOC119455468 [Dermacentor silvarum]